MPHSCQKSVVSVKIRGGRLARVTVLAALAIAAGCGQARSTSDDGVSGGSTGSCVTCHGDSSRSPASTAAAPPVDTRGQTATSAPGVGAHQRHLTGGSIRSAIACTECHRVPTTAAHALEPLDLTWGPLASARGTTPSFNATSLTCANYCHGSAATGGTNSAPIWNRVDGTQAACGTCHGLPPAAPHPAVSGGLSACAACHPGTVNGSGAILVAGGLHVNGVVEAAGGDGSCTGCHGDPNRDGPMAAAPPADTHGNTVTTAPGVGAHERHLTGGSIRGPVACSDCHAVPTDLSHVNGRLDLTWGALARAGGATPSFDAARLTCANYCHGATATGGTNYRADLEPRRRHPGGLRHLPRSPSRRPASHRPGGLSACAACHPGTVSASGAILVAGGLHVNGVVDLVGGNGSCTGCHGDPTRLGSIAAAPPADTPETPPPPLRGSAPTSATSPAGASAARSRAPTATRCRPTSPT